MFERFTEPAGRVLFFGRFEAQQGGSAAINVEHLLLGILRESAAARQLLADAGVTLDACRKELTPRASGHAPSALDVEIPFSEAVSQMNEVEVPFSYAAREALHATAEEADRLLHDEIGPEHLLLGILRDESSVAANVLNAHGIGLANARDRVVQARHEHPFAPRPRGHADPIAAGVYVARSHRTSASVRSTTRDPLEFCCVEKDSFVWTLGCLTLRAILSEAYDVPDARIDLAEALDDATLYDVSVWVTVPEPWVVMRERLQDGIRDHFRLSIQLENRPTDVYVVTAPAGRVNAPKRNAASGGLGAGSSAVRLSAGETTPWREMGARLNALGGGSPPEAVPIVGVSGLMSIGVLCDMLERFLGRPVVDETAVEGTYELDIRPGAGTNEAFFETLKNQLGLVVLSATRTLPILSVRSLA